MNRLTITIIVLICFGAVSSAQRRSRRPTKARTQVVVPPVSCPELFEATLDIGDEGPLLRKTQHNSDCQKYFECVTNRWIARDCPGGTTFNQLDKGCDSLKTCVPRQVKELYEEGIAELKELMGIEDEEPKEV